MQDELVCTCNAPLRYAPHFVHVCAVPCAPRWGEGALKESARRGFGKCVSFSSVPCWCVFFSRVLVVFAFACSAHIVFGVQLKRRIYMVATQRMCALKRIRLRQENVKMSVNRCCCCCERLLKYLEKRVSRLECIQCTFVYIVLCVRVVCHCHVCIFGWVRDISSCFWCEVMPLHTHKYQANSW